ncbi:hypothetical protein, conserved [Plasmodium gonderi]|uniref:Variable surface protein n=1 Tax=Plasmodium gonderi TaxID=77519 RepID=A0A1Y1JIY0_PLAGO|nr:hypothetical protein, conserved [Plasmodium gonderi]GAW80054.1 hypothetical protein, conserved [Plasmodium gonderi]
MHKILGASFYLFILLFYFYNPSETFGIENKKGLNDAIKEKSCLRRGNLMHYFLADEGNFILDTDVNVNSKTRREGTGIPVEIFADVGDEDANGDEKQDVDSIDHLGNIHKEFLLDMIEMWNNQNYDKYGDKKRDQIKEIKNLKTKQYKPNIDDMFGRKTHSRNDWRGNKLCAYIYVNCLVQSYSGYREKNQMPIVSKVSSISASIPVPLCQLMISQPTRKCPKKGRNNNCRYSTKANNFLHPLIGKYKKKDKTDRNNIDHILEESNENILNNLINEKSKNEISEEDEDDEGDEHVLDYDKSNPDENDYCNVGYFENGNLYFYPIEVEEEDEISKNSNRKTIKNKKRKTREKKSKLFEAPISIFNIKRYKNINRIKNKITKIWKKMINAFMYDPDYYGILVYLTTDAADLIMNQ